MPLLMVKDGRRSYTHHVLPSYPTPGGTEGVGTQIFSLHMLLFDQGKNYFQEALRSDLFISYWTELATPLPLLLKLAKGKGITTGLEYS